MKRSGVVSIIALAVLAYAAPAAAQFGSILKNAERAKKIRDIQFTDAEEQELGAAVSEKIRLQYGVVQDPAVHRYVSLVGNAVAQAGTRPTLQYRFIILDTDGINAFAAPGGFIHITRGALGLMTSEAELAHTLAHELAHVTEKHTVRAIQKSRTVDMASSESAGGGVKGFVVSKFADQAFKIVYAGFDRGDELEADKVGLVMANKTGYAPQGLGAFLQRLLDRNKASTIKQGLFASHPEMKERIDKAAEQTKADRLAATATLEDRFRKHIAYEAKPLAEIAVVIEGAAGLAGGGAASTPPEGDKAEKKDEEPKKKKGFGLGRLIKPAAEETKSAQVVSSGGSRGVDVERAAKGGGNPAIVAVALKAGELEAFKKEGKLT